MIDLKLDDSFQGLISRVRLFIKVMYALRLFLEKDRRIKKIKWTQADVWKRGTYMYHPAPSRRE